MPELLDYLVFSEKPDADIFGGVDVVIDRFDDLFAHDPVVLIEAVCDWWDILEHRRAEAIEVLTHAASFEQFELDEVHDAILRNDRVLGDMSGELVNVMRANANLPGIYGDVFTESWTRLALGGWCVSLPIRAHLEARATCAAEEGDTTPYLVRSVAAALTQWGDTDLETALVKVGDIEEFTSDVNFELGMHALGGAMTLNEPATALQSLRNAVEFLRVTGDRADALAFRMPLEGLLGFIAGDRVTVTQVHEARTRVHKYLLGYSGLDRHWRQGRADVSSSWSILLEMLEAASRTDDTHWFDPSDVIEAAAALYVSATSLDIAIRKDIPVAAGVPALLRTRVRAAFINHPPSMTFLNQWLERTETNDVEPSVFAVVREFRDELLDATFPKVSSGLESDDRLAKEIDAALEDFLCALQKTQKRASKLETDLVRRVMGDIREIIPSSAMPDAASLIAVALSLVQFTAYHLDQKQTGQRKIAWLGGVPDAKGLFPKEHVLSEALAGWFDASGLQVQVEKVNIGGGEVDLAIHFPTHTFYIEVKRVLTREEDEAAFARYGNQATQYAATDVPVVFLALLDYAPRTVRIDLEGVIWTKPHRPAPESREYALTGFRVQGNVASPSESSRRRPKRNL